jgi:thiol-disulfide isomerase/thioredoxin
MKKMTSALIAVLILFGCGPSEPISESTHAAEESVALTPIGAAPEFDLADVASGSLKSEDLKGKVVIADVWATWCVPCIKEIPSFNEIHENYDGKGVQMVAITVESGPIDEVKPKVEEFKMKYPVVMGTEEVVAGFGGIIGFPTTFLIGKDWKIYKRYLGMTPNKKQLIEKDIAALLAQ